MNFTAQQIAAFVSGEIIGNARVEVHDVSPIEDGRPGTLSYVTDAKYLPALAGTAASVVLLTRSLYDASLSCQSTLILVDNARQAIGTLLQGVSEFLRPRKHGVEQPAFVAEGTTLPDDTYIGAFAYIGKGVKLGKGVQIYPQAYIGDYTTIGDNTVIYSGVKIYDHCTIGRDCIIHSGCVIGADGFGFEPDAQGVNRNDLICIKYELNSSTSVESASLAVLKGATSSGTPSDPTIPSGSILNGASAAYMPLWRIPISGITVGTPVKLYGEVLASLDSPLLSCRFAVHSRQNRSYARRGFSQ